MIGKILSKEVIIRTATSVVLFFVVVNIFYYYFNQQSMFTDWHYYSWVEYAYGTALMGILTFVIEAVRSIISNEG